MSFSTIIEKVIKNIQQACKKANRNYDKITIIGVTKYVTIEQAEQLVESGIINIGENRTEEMLHKYETIKEKANWHFIGTLQSRKVKDIIQQITMSHSLDRLSVARQINNRSERVIDCFVQVNVSGEETKHGLSPEEVIPFIEDVKQYERVNIVGLMTMAPHIEDEEELRSVFRKLGHLRDDVKAKQFSHAPCQFLSMGMSNDYHIAIEEGATHIRIGSKLFE